MNYIIGIIAMIGGFVSLIINNLVGAYCCFGFAFILWCVMTVASRYDKDPRLIAYICDENFLKSFIEDATMFAINIW